MDKKVDVQFWEKMYRAIAMHTEDQFRWIVPPPAGLDFQSKYIIWSGIIQLELCFFLINLKSYVSEGLHNLWYEMN